MAWFRNVSRAELQKVIDVVEAIGERVEAIKKTVKSRGGAQAGLSRRVARIEGYLSSLSNPPLPLEEEEEIDEQPENGLDRETLRLRIGREDGR